MKKDIIAFRTVIGSMMLALGFFVPASAQDEPPVEREYIKLDPLHFVDSSGVAVTSEEENQKLWNELMKYKLWGTDSVVFAKGKFSIRETSGYTGTARDRIIFMADDHTLGGPIVSGGNLEIIDGSANNDVLIKGLVRADSLLLPKWYSAQNTSLNAVMCFEHQVFMQENNNGRDVEHVNNFINNVRNAGGQVYADWNTKSEGSASALTGLNLNGSYENCPSDVPQPDKHLRVPVLDEAGITWGDAIVMTSNYENETAYIHIPPISENDVKNSHTWYDMFVKDIQLGIEGGSKGKKLYILMPSGSKNANGKTGRLTRIFSKDGFNFHKSANDTKIQIVYVNDEASWNGSSWNNFDLSKSVVVADSNYAGNLMFYTTKDVKWESMVDIDYQGTFITTGRFVIQDHMNLAGQLIAGKTLWFESDVNGEFHYVPFNSPEIKPDIFFNNGFKEDDNKWYNMEFYLTDTTHAEVSFEYCFSFFDEIPDADTKYAAYKGRLSGEFAKRADLADNPSDPKDVHFMPFCSEGKRRTMVIKKGDRKPTIDSLSAFIKVNNDGLVEDDEFMLFRIFNLNGATITGNRFDGGLLIKLVDANNNRPHFVNPEKTNLIVSENVSKATAGVVKAKDDEDDAFIYDIVGGTAKDLFEIDPTKGTVSMKNGVDPFDYEAWIEAKNSNPTKEPYTIQVEICDAKATSFNALLCDDFTFKISVRDINEKPYFTNKDTIYIAEDSKVAEKVKFEDTDKYNTDGSLTTNEVVLTGGDVDVFEVTATGIVKVKTGVVLDYETKNEYKLTLRVQDAIKDVDGNYVFADLFDEKTFVVIVQDVNDGPEFDFKVYNGKIDENSIAGTEVDMDNAIHATTTQEGAKITYILLDSTNSFVIDPGTGVITVADGAILDFETKNVYEMNVVASDASGNNAQSVQTDTAKVIIKLNDLNEKPIFVEPTTAFTFPENAKGYEIGTIPLADLDTAKKFTNDRFEIVGVVDGFYLDPETGVLTTTRKFDYETDPKTYELTIRIYDVSGRADLTATGKITIELVNVNEPPYLKDIVFTVPETEPIGTAVKEHLDALDPDLLDDSGKFKYFILDGTKEVLSTNEFKLDSATGVFTVASPLDFEKTESYSVKVRVKDENGAYSDTTVTINVLDMNEAPSVIVDTIYVYENQAVNNPFSSVKTDQDDPDTKNADFRNNVYENTDGSEIFSVKPNGDVVLLKPVDYESDSLYTITVRVTDKDDKTLTSTKNVVVKVKDIYEKSIVEITRVETKDSIYLKPDSVFVNVPVVDIEWKADDKIKSSTDSLRPGCNVITKTYKDPTKNEAGSASVVVCYSNAAPVVTVSANGKDVTAENIYTVVEKTTKNDTAIYVNKKANDIWVTVKDTAANVSKSFTVNLNLDTVSVSSKEFKNIQKMADTKVTRKNNPASGITTVPENGSYYKNTYTETINGVETTVTYYTDRNGKDVKRSVVTSSGETKEIAVIEVSYKTKIGDKFVTISYFADASTGERVSLDTGLSDKESVLSADGENVSGQYKVSYDYTDKNGNTVEVSYYLDEKGKIAKNNDGNIGYNVSYTYVNKFGNSSKKTVFIVLDQKGPVVKIVSPVEDEVITSNYAEIKWTVDGVEQDTLRVQGLDNGVQTVVRVFRDKAGNESRDSVHVIVKKAKDIAIEVEKPVTKIDRDSVERYFKENPPVKGQNFGVTFFNYEKNAETEEIIGVGRKTKDGSGKEPYPGFGSHLGPTLVVDARVPVASSVGGLATLDDIMTPGGMVAIEGVDAANGKKMPVEEYVEKYCTDEFKNSMTSDYSKMNLYWSTLKVKIWVYTNTGAFVEKYSYEYDIDNPAYVNEAGLLRSFFEMKPDENGDVRTKKGRLLGTGAYLFKTEVKISSKLRCDLPPLSKDEANKKKNAVIKTSDDLLKVFGYRRPVNK